MRKTGIANEAKQVAYEVWVDLSTRKLALDFDEENDVICEIYNSWYKFFAELRNQIKVLGYPQENNDVRELLITIMDETIRPHLTKYSAAFRTWWETDAKKIKNDIKRCIVNLVDERIVRPQEVQKEYLDYKQLIADIKKINKQCQKHLTELEVIFKQEDLSEAERRLYGIK